jgi:eukaryotic-like serine/threonine-protein kinase
MPTHQRYQELEKKVSLMRSISFFSNFCADELMKTADLSIWLKFKKDDLIIREGDLGSSFWVILKGKVAVSRLVLGQDEPQILATIPAGECFGEMSMISGEPRSADVVALDEVFLFKIDGDRLNLAPEKLQLKFFKNFATILVARLQRTSQQMVQKQPGPIGPSAAR